MPSALGHVFGLSVLMVAYVSLKSASKVLRLFLLICFTLMYGAFDLFPLCKNINIAVFI